MKKKQLSSKTNVKHNYQFRRDAVGDGLGISFDLKEDCDFCDPSGIFLIGNGKFTELVGITKMILLDEAHMPYKGRLVSGLSFIYQIPGKSYHCGFAFGMIQEDKPNLIFINRTTKVGLTIFIPQGYKDLEVKEINRIWEEEMVGRDRYRSLTKVKANA